MEWNEHVHGPIIFNGMDITIKRKQPIKLREFSMPKYGTKRRASGSYARPASKRTRVFAVPRRIGVGPQSNSCIIPITTQYDMDLTADPIYAFQWNQAKMFVNGTGISITGLAALNDVFELLRVQKVEIMMLPAATDLAYDRQTLATGTTNIPWVYEAVDYIDPVNGASLTQIKQNPTCRTHLMNKPYKRTIYPKIVDGTDSTVDVSKNGRNVFKRSNSGDEDTLWNGYVFAADMKDVVWTYGQVRLSFKVYYECLMSK